MRNLAGRTLEDLLQEHDDYLVKDFLPFIESHVLDWEYGGFMCNTDQTGKNITTHKRTWYDGRGIWVYSFLYNHIKKDSSYLNIAKKTIDLVMQTKSEDEQLWPWAYDRRGKNLDEHSPDIYGNLFIAEGLAEYSAASGDDSFWLKSKEILLQCVEIYDRDGYSYKLEYSPLDTFTDAERVLGHWMIMLRLTTNLLRTKADREIEEINNRCIDALINKHFNQKFNLMNEVLKHDFSQVSDEIEQFVYIGHAIESLWMVMDEALRREDQKLFDLAAERFKFHVEVAWDDVYGGVFHCLDHVGRNKWLLDKILWAQHEVLIGLLMLIEYKEDDWAIRWFDKVYNYVIAKFPMQKHGLTLWQIGGNRTVDFDGKGDRIENFHHPRYLMLSQLALRRMIDKIAG